MSKIVLITAKAPKAIGPYSQAVEKNGFVFVSGQIPADAAGQPVAGDIKIQAEAAIKNIEAILGAAGLDLSHVVKTTVYMKNLQDFPAMNEVYARFFKEPYPARATIEVSNLPKGAAIEIEALAVR
ncbi:MAG: RidA family protein [Elusimicrobia bacterium]|nr:RidA family protein [Elusimicrobiota bacterium]